MSSRQRGSGETNQIRVEHTVAGSKLVKFIGLIAAMFPKDTDDDLQPELRTVDIVPLVTDDEAHELERAVQQLIRSKTAQTAWGHTR